MLIISLIELDKMPQDCDYCPLNYDDMYCTAVKLPKGRNILYDGKRPDWCPLIDITKPAMEHMRRLTELFSKTAAKLKEANNEE